MEFVFRFFERLKICIEFKKFSLWFLHASSENLFHFSPFNRRKFKFLGMIFSSYFRSFYFPESEWVWRKKMQIYFKYFSTHDVTFLQEIILIMTYVWACMQASIFCSISIPRKIFSLLKYLKMFISASSFYICQCSVIATTIHSRFNIASINHTEILFTSITLKVLTFQFRMGKIVKIIVRCSLEYFFLPRL